MFETAELGREVDKQDFDRLVPKLRMDLLRAQNELYQKKSFRVIVLINGVEGAGKGETVNKLHEWMDPRYLETTAFGAPSDEENERPFFWRFWRALPPRGKLGILFGSWYSRPIVERVNGGLKRAQFDEELTRINLFERELADDGALIIKFWFHLGKKAQKKRLKEISNDPKQSWRVTKNDWKLFEKYDDFYEVCTRALRETNTGHAPWTVVEGADARYRYLTAGQHIYNQISKRLEQQARAASKTNVVPPQHPLAGTDLKQPTILNKLDLSQHVKKEKYEAELETLQGRLNVLSRQASKAGISSTLVFEGPDAAGKGGAIRRVTAALDARYYRVIPIAAPTDEERAHHYLWRFWRHIPRAGRVTIYDRSWYGRVLVERVEGFAREDEWMRAYREINEFEEELTAARIVVLKYWLHIGKDEQLRRFKEREKTGYKQYKITAEDYRNREKWEAYELAVNDMVERTSTEFAPWHLIEANDKYHARLKILRTFCAALERSLGKKK